MKREKHKKSNIVTSHTAHCGYISVGLKSLQADRFSSTLFRGGLSIYEVNLKCKSKALKGTHEYMNLKQNI